MTLVKMHQVGKVAISKVLLCISLLLFVLFFTGCSGQSAALRLKAQDGKMDLTRVTFTKDIIQLNGEWELYWNCLLEPDEIDPKLMTGYITVPGSWNKYKMEDETISGSGYATYRLNFKIDANEKLALKIPRLHTAYKLWMNGKLIASAGTVGKTIDTTISQYLPQVAFFYAKQGDNEIVVQVSNFHHRSGGILERINLGSEEQILRLRYNRLANDVLLFGCLIYMGLYHLSLFFFRKKDTSAFYFGMFCILVGFRTLLVGECLLIYLFPRFSWEIAHKLMTLTYYFVVPFVLMFFLSVFPTYFHKRMVRIAQLLAAIFGLLILFTPARVFTVVNPTYQIWSIIAIAYILIILIKINIREEKVSWLISIGASAFFLTSINDIVFVSTWMNDVGPMFFRSLFRIGNLSSAGMLIFTFANSLLLAKKFSDSLEKEEIAMQKLTEINTNLDKIVLHRTEELVDSNEKIKQQQTELEKVNTKLQELSTVDPLTKLWNRRKFDEFIYVEWERCLKHQYPIAVLFIDIDFFKGYNDYYGHLAGDECLTKIGQTIRGSLSSFTDMVARYGGEEFIVLLPEKEKEEAISIANGLRKRIEDLQIPHKQSSVSSFVTVSIGVTYTTPNDNQESEDFFKAADIALYQAKAVGRNQVKFLYEYSG